MRDNRFRKPSLRLFQPLAEKLTTEEMQKLNAQVDLDNKEEERVARERLKENGLI